MSPATSVSDIPRTTWSSVINERRDPRVSSSRPLMLRPLVLSRTRSLSCSGVRPDIGGE